MAINALYKRAALLGGAGSVAGGYILINNLSTRSEKEKEKEKEKENKVTSIEDKLVGEGYTLLDFKNTTGNDWDKIKKAYKEENADNKRFTGVDKNNEGTLLEAIKNYCLQYLKRGADNEDNYKMSRRWCIVPVSVESRLTGRTWLKVEGGNEDDGDWGKIVTKHESNSNDKFLTFEGGKNSTDKRDEIKKQCKEKRSFETTNSDFEDALKKVDLWCTKESASQGQ